MWLTSARRPLLLVPIIVCLSWLLLWYNFDDAQSWRVPSLSLHHADGKGSGSSSGNSHEESHSADPSNEKETAAEIPSVPQKTDPALPSSDHKVNSNNSSNPSEEERFLAAAVTALPEGDFDGSAIYEVCNGTEIWDPFLTFDCLGIEGGIGNVKQIFLSCLRYAMDAGAGLIMPQINTRDEKDLVSLESGKADMSYLFDQDLMLARLQSSCPQMPIYESRSELEKTGKITAVVPIFPRDMNKEAGLPDDAPHVFSIMDHPELQKNRAPAGEHTVVELLITLAYFPVCHDSVAFVNSFGQLLPFRQDVEHLAAKTLWALRTRYNLPIEPAQPISTGAYLGVHLRTDADAVRMGWPSYADNAARFLDLAATTALPVMYVASGDADAVAALARDAAARFDPPLPVVTKLDLLDSLSPASASASASAVPRDGPPGDDDLARLRALSWDQQALVDFLVLLRASYLGGMTESSFSWNLAVRRRVRSTRGSCGTPPHWRLPNNTVFQDEFTNLLGGHPSDWEAHMWP
ncbi:MAG: hypothetical protein M1818_000096 [Claussenomyces sp. TS43310]|nr:MAG: hypothetical protein M1818_000096 [Claussenomyces sp. TS43310]